jgi:hypothetical protein
VATAGTTRPVKRIYGWIGVICWLLIVPAKAARHLDPAIHPALIDVAPSFFGPLGLLLVILSSEHRFARVTIAQATLAASVVALALEFAQMLPLVRRIYTFDWLDVGVTLAGVSAGVVIGTAVGRRHRPEAPAPPD